jgi:hypothetical protein
MVKSGKRPTQVEAGAELPMASVAPRPSTRIDFEPRIDFIAASALESPDLPRPPAAPRVSPGLDFSPTPGHRAHTARPAAPPRAPTVLPNERAQLLLAATAVLGGFGGGLLIAWVAGLL